MDLRGLEQRVEDGSNFGAAARPRTIMIFSADDGPVDPSFRGVVVERDLSVLHEAREPVPVGHDVRCFTCTSW